MGDTMTEHNLAVRQFQKGDEAIVQKWRDEFPLKDGMEGCPVELGDVYSDDKHFIVYKKDTKEPIGSMYLREIEPEKSTEVILAIGDYRYLNKNVFIAIVRCVTQYLKESYCEKQVLFLFDMKSVLQMLKGDC